MNRFLQDFWDFLFKRRNHPVYKREINGWSHIKFWKRLRRGCLPLMLLTILLPTGCAAVGGLLILIDNGTMPPSAPALLGVFSALLFVALMMSGLIEMVASFLSLLLSATTISSEMEAETFTLIRVTTVPVQEVVLAKYGAAVRQIYPVYRFITLLRLLISVGLFIIMVGFLILAFPLEGVVVGIVGILIVVVGNPFLLLYVLTILASLLFSGIILSLVFYLQPLINMLFYNAIGILGSAHARTRSQGIFTAIGFRIVIWGISYGISVAINYAIQIGGFLILLAFEEIAWLSALATNNPGVLIVGGAGLMILWYLLALLIPLAMSIIFLRMAITRARKLPYRI